MFRTCIYKREQAHVESKIDSRKCIDLQLTDTEYGSQRACRWSTKLHTVTEKHHVRMNALTYINWTPCEKLYVQNLEKSRPNINYYSMLMFFIDKDSSHS